MKLFEAKQIAAIDSATIRNETKALELMNRAADLFCSYIKKRIYKKQKGICICGKGNNGGDGLLIAEKLLLEGYNIRIVVVDISNSSSPGFDFHLERMLIENGSNISRAKTITKKFIQQNDFIIDALFGNGLTRALSDDFAKIIHNMNDSAMPIFSVDIASGLYRNFRKGDPACKPACTFSFEFPKLEFLLSEYQDHVGDWSFGSIGLKPELAENIDSPYHFIGTSELANLLKTRPPFSHKGNFGTALLIAGHSGMAGAGILCAKAAIRAGIGICKLVSDENTKSIYQQTVFEAIAEDYEEFGNKIKDIDWEKTVLAIGPGLGTSMIAKKILVDALSHSQKACIIDADALNLLAKDQSLLKLVPKGSILTPHIKEFNRLFGSCETDWERIEIQLRASRTLEVFIILKGKYSIITSPDGRIYFNSSGNPGMATGGTGDVLTGILAALLGQKYTALETAIIGTFIHGFAGDLAANDKSDISLVAGDLIEYLPMAFQYLYKIK